ncbi:hypothetical protein FACS1894120_0290 [Clostridia bacterium]|nr:hypothetical protein FACS1894120_0290 [Clostridia bacterium]
MKGYENRNGIRKYDGYLLYNDPNGHGIYYNDEMHYAVAANISVESGFINKNLQCIRRHESKHLIFENCDFVGSDIVDLKNCKCETPVKSKIEEYFREEIESVRITDCAAIQNIFKDLIKFEECKIKKLVLSGFNYGLDGDNKGSQEEHKESKEDTLSGWLEKQEYLEAVTLSYCYMKELPEFKNPGKIKYLDISRTAVTKIDLTGYTALERLNVSDNRIAVIKGLDLLPLIRLDLSYTDFEEVPRLDRCLVEKQLKYIDLSGTKIKDIRILAVQLELIGGIKFIGLSNCKLCDVTLPELLAVANQTNSDVPFRDGLSVGFDDDDDELQNCCSLHNTAFRYIDTRLLIDNPKNFVMYYLTQQYEPLQFRNVICIVPDEDRQCNNCKETGSSITDVLRDFLGIRAGDENEWFDFSPGCRTMKRLPGSRFCREIGDAGVFQLTIFSDDNRSQTLIPAFLNESAVYIVFINSENIYGANSNINFWKSFLDSSLRREDHFFVIYDEKGTNTEKNPKEPLFNISFQKSESYQEDIYMVSRNKEIKEADYDKPYIEKIKNIQNKLKDLTNQSFTNRAHMPHQWGLVLTHTMRILRSEGYLPPDHFRSLVNLYLPTEPNNESTARNLVKYFSSIGLMHFQRDGSQIYDVNAYMNFAFKTLEYASENNGRVIFDKLYTSVSFDRAGVKLRYQDIAGLIHDMSLISDNERQVCYKSTSKETVFTFPYFCRFYYNNIGTKIKAMDLFKRCCGNGYQQFVIRTKLLTPHRISGTICALTNAAKATDGRFQYIYSDDGLFLYKKSGEIRSEEDIRSIAFVQFSPGTDSKIELYFWSDEIKKETEEQRPTATENIEQLNEMKQLVFKAVQSYNFKTESRTYELDAEALITKENIRYEALHHSGMVSLSAVYSAYNTGYERFLIPLTGEQIPMKNLYENLVCEAYSSMHNECFAEQD